MKDCYTHLLVSSLRLPQGPLLPHRLCFRETRAWDGKSTNPKAKLLAGTPTTAEKRLKLTIYLHIKSAWRLLIVAAENPIPKKYFLTFV